MGVGFSGDQQSPLSEPVAGNSSYQLGRALMGNPSLSSSLRATGTYSRLSTLMRITVPGLKVGDQNGKDASIAHP